MTRTSEKKWLRLLWLLSGLLLINSAEYTERLQGAITKRMPAAIMPAIARVYTLFYVRVLRGA